MVADRKWVEKNLGFDPISTPPPAKTFSVNRVAKAAVKPATKASQRISSARSSISIRKAPAGQSFFAFSTATGLSRFTDIRGRRDLRRRPDRSRRERARARCRSADVLLVTWTVDEGHALSRVLTPGKDSRNDYRALHA